MRGQLHLRKTFAVRKESDVNQQKRSEIDHSTLKISSFISTNNFIILIHYSLEWTIEWTDLLIII